MNMHIKTTAEGCHLSVNIRIQSHTLLNLSDNDEGDIDLLPGITYRFEWFVFAGKAQAHARIQAVVTPDNQGFDPLDIDKNYPGGVQDGNVFLFTLS